MSYPTWNKNEAKNIVCWQCEHFQRRDNTPGTQNCQGECRKNVPAWDGDMRNDVQAADGTKFGVFAFVPFGNTTWCNGFQKSLEDNIPAVADGRANCADQDWADWETPFINMYGIAPRLSKKSMLDSCWYCENFQRDPENQGPGQNCGGYCFLAPPTPFVRTSIDYGTMVVQDINNANAQPFIQNSAWMWCSKWERSIDAVPDPPEDSGVVCGGGS